MRFGHGVTFTPESERDVIYFSPAAPRLVVLELCRFMYPSEARAQARKQAKVA